MAKFATGQVLRLAPNRRSFDAVLIPDGTVIPNVGIADIAQESIPAEGAIVLLWLLDSFGARFISKLVDPNTDAVFSRVNVPVGQEPFIDAGEVSLSSKGGGSLFLDKEGDVELTAGSITERLALNGSTRSLTAQAGLIDLTAPSSVVLGAFLELGSSVSLTNPGTSVLGVARLGIENPQTSFPGNKTVIHEIGVDALGNITIQNSLSAMLLTAVGNFSVTSPTAATVTAPNINLTGSTSVTGTTTITGATTIAGDPTGADSITVIPGVGLALNTETNLTLPNIPGTIKVGLIPGFTGTVANPTSITVLNGIVTAVT